VYTHLHDIRDPYFRSLKLCTDRQKQTELNRTEISTELNRTEISVRFSSVALHGLFKENELQAVQLISFALYTHYELLKLKKPAERSKIIL